MLRNPLYLKPGEHDPPEGTRASHAKRARKGGRKGRAEAAGIEEEQSRTEDGKQSEAANQHLAGVPSTTTLEGAKDGANGEATPAGKQGEAGGARGVDGQRIAMEGK